MASKEVEKPGVQEPQAPETESTAMLEQAAKILEDAKRVAAEILENAQQAAQVQDMNGPVNGGKKEDDYFEEMVTVELFKDGRDYKGDVFLSLNGETIRVKRGVPMKIKRKFAILIEQANREAIRTAEYDENMQQEFRANMGLLI